MEAMESALLEFITEELVGNRTSAPLTSEDDLLGSGLVDSLGVVRLVSFIQDRFEVDVPLEDLTIEYFETVKAISSYLKPRLPQDSVAV